MRRVLKPIITGLLLVLGLALYREWVIRHAPPIFLPLGFFGTTISVVVPEQAAQDPANWQDPVQSVVTDDASFDDLARSMNATERTTDILVTGATFGGVSAALSAESDGASVVLASENDWQAELLSQAGVYAQEPQPSDVSSSAIERLLRFTPGLRKNSLGQPNTSRPPEDIVAQLRRSADAAKRLEVLSPYAIVAFAKNADGALDRALLQSTDHANAVAVRFSYLIDGTQEGSSLAQAGIATATSYDALENVGEPGTLTAKAIENLSAGYAMSGVTVPGIGKRLDGSRVQMGIVDRGYNGRFVAPSRVDGCWTEDLLAIERKLKKPFIARQPILRTTVSGCSATMTIESSFVDTVEVYFVNHGNDTVSATVHMGSGGAIDFELPTNAATPLVRIGAFTVTPQAPITVDVRSVLPTDRLEGLVVRKLNTGFRGTSFAVQGGAPSPFSVDGWQRTSYDVYLRAGGVLGLTNAFIDELPHPATRIGAGMYMLSDVVLAPGEHTLRLPDNEGEQTVSVVPVRPYRERLVLSPIPAEQNAHAWTFRPERDGDAGLVVPPGSCAGLCTITLLESGSLVPSLRTSVHEGAELIAGAVPLENAAVRAGALYVVTADASYDSRNAPIVFMMDAAADLHAIGAGSVGIEPPVAGVLYDVWLRTLRSANATLIVGSEARTFADTNEWTYAGTLPLPAEGTFATTGGGIELWAMPNVAVDAYRIPVTPTSDGTSVRDLPPGDYSIASFGLENPLTVNVTDEDDGHVTPILFDGDRGMFQSERTLAKGVSPATIRLTTPWPQDMIFYESLDERSAASVGTHSGMLLPLLNGPVPWEYMTPDEMAGFGIGNDSRGLLVFDPQPLGIGPVTIGMQQSADASDRLRKIVDDMYVLFRLGRTDLTDDFATCDEASDPTCDPRRYVRAPGVFGTRDGLSPVPFHPDARRLAGRDTLTASGAFAFERTCEQCERECVAKSIKNGRCIATEPLAIPADAIVSFPGTTGTPNIVSPTEQTLETLQALLKSMRRDGLIGPAPTYLEATPPARDVTVTLGMVMAKDADNVLVANTTISATHQASRALRSHNAQLAIGSAVGHAAAFSLEREHSPLSFIARSPEAVARLQRYLVDKSVTVVPVSGIEDDPLLVKAVELRILDQRTALKPAWKDGRLTFGIDPLRDADLPALTTLIFGTQIRTVREALQLLPGSSADKSDPELMRVGFSTGFLDTKILRLRPGEIMNLPIDPSFLLKAEYLYSTLH